MAVHHRLGQPRRARGVDDPQRMAEREALVAGCGIPGHGRLPARALAPIDRAFLRQRPLHLHDMLDAGQLGQQLRDFPGPVVRLAVVAVAVHGEQHLGFDLAQAVQHDGRPHVGRAAGPDGADAGAGQKCDHRFGAVGHVAGHAVARPHAPAAQRGRQGGGGAFQLGPGNRLQRHILAARDHGRPIRRGMAEHMLGKIQPRPGKPLGARHAAPAQRGLAFAIGLDVEEAPDRLPEVVQMLDRPAPQLGVIVGRNAFFPCQPVLVLRQAAGLQLLGARGPENVGGGGRQGMGHGRQSIMGVSAPRRRPPRCR